jgi:hypothetical protein
VENERAWKVDIAAIKAAGYNLDQKNPHAPDAVSHDPDELLRDYAKLQREAQRLRDQLKAILAESLGGAGRECGARGSGAERAVSGISAPALIHQFELSANAPGGVPRLESSS